MILSDKTLIELIDSQQLIILPKFDRKNIRPLGIRFHLGNDLLIPIAGQTVDLLDPIEIKYDKIKLASDGYVLKPGQFVLGHTYESIQVPRNIVPILDGRSTVARIGLALHCTSAVADGSYESPIAITLEIKNEGNFNIILKPKIPIGMFVFHQLTDNISQAVQSKYKNQSTATIPNLKNQLR